VSESAADRTYQVVVNDEEQFSLWDARREPPAGWRPSGFSGGREQCLEHIAGVWKDIRPCSARPSADGRR
jgi:MbtH protein